MHLQQIARRHTYGDFCLVLFGKLFGIMDECDQKKIRTARMVFRYSTTQVVDCPIKTVPYARCLIERNGSVNFRSRVYTGVNHWWRRKRNTVKLFIHKRIKCRKRKTNNSHSQNREIFIAHNNNQNKILQTMRSQKHHSRKPKFTIS